MPLKDVPNNGYKMSIQNLWTAASVAAALTQRRSSIRSRRAHIPDACSSDLQRFMEFSPPFPLTGALMGASTVWGTSVKLLREFD